DAGLDVRVVPLRGVEDVEICVHNAGVRENRSSPHSDQLHAAESGAVEKGIAPDFDEGVPVMGKRCYIHGHTYIVPENDATRSPAPEPSVDPEITPGSDSDPGESIPQPILIAPQERPSRRNALAGPAENSDERRGHVTHGLVPYDRHLNRPVS